MSSLVRQRWVRGREGGREEEGERDFNVCICTDESKEILRYIIICTISLSTVEPLNNRHIGMDHFVHCSKVVLYWRQKCILPLYRQYQKASIIQLQVSFLSFISTPITYSGIIGPLSESGKHS